MRRVHAPISYPSHSEKRNHGIAMLFPSRLIFVHIADQQANVAIQMSGLRLLSILILMYWRTSETYWISSRITLLPPNRSKNPLGSFRTISRFKGSTKVIQGVALDIYFRKVESRLTLRTASLNILRFHQILRITRSFQFSFVFFYTDLTHC